MNCTVVRMKAKEICSPIIQVQGNVKPISASSGWFTHFRKRIWYENVKLEGKVDSTDQEAVGEFEKITAKHYTGKKLYG